MKITKIEQAGKYKYKVFIDNNYVFWLSRRELFHWKLKEELEITQEYYAQILTESILEKCKRKAISYLEYSGRTEHEMRQKLQQQLYVEPIVEQTIQYLYQYHYLDDSRYIENFIQKNQEKHSRRWMEQKLKQKGIKKEQMEFYLKDEEVELEALRKSIEKKCKGNLPRESKEREKLLAYLCRQGFSISHSLKVMKEYD